ncbi:hypothetical protein [Sphingobacterium sp.]|uniref:hypothetical protein n=1 Tax=Sphingobacterium sp. TaxID=341027 RepID=UPI0028B1B23B|nr:hypothetical protein [Sphingobacterium sp.]
MQHSYLTDVSVCFDGFYTPNGDSVSKFAQNPDYLQFINKGYRHSKVIAFAKGTEQLAAKSFIEKDQGVIFESDPNWTDAFVNALKKHRVWERENPRKVPS